MTAFPPTRARNSPVVTPPSPSSATPLPDGLDELLAQVANGDKDARDRLFGLLYEELYVQARRHMPAADACHSLQPTALVNEAYLRLCRGRETPWKDRTHFLMTASQAMRHVLVDHARAKNTHKREPGTKAVPFDDQMMIEFEDRAHDMEKLDCAMVELATFDPEMAKAIELRFFGGASLAETSSALGIAERTLQRRWAATRAWLYKEIQ